jgi:hypothetical protein
LLDERTTSDHIEITQLLQRYFHALDWKDYALLDRVFTADAELHYDMGGMGEGAKADLPTMVKQFDAFNRVFAFTQHIMGQPLIDCDGDRATSTTALRAIHVQVALDGSENTWVVYGFYEDLHRRTEAGWRIQKRYFRATHFDGKLLPPEKVESFPVPPWRTGGQSEVKVEVP